MTISNTHSRSALSHSSETNTESSTSTPHDVVVAQELKKRKRNAKLALRQKAFTYCQDLDASWRLAACISVLPFDAASTIKLPATFRELLHCFLSRVLLLYILSFGTESLSSSARAELAAWGRRCITLLLDVLQLEPSPSLTIIYDALEWFANGTEIAAQRNASPRPNSQGIRKPVTTWKRKAKPEQNASSSSSVDMMTGSTMLDPVSNKPITPNGVASSTSSLIFDAEDMRANTSHQTIPPYFYEMINPQPLKSLLLSEGSPSTALQLVINETFKDSLERRRAAPLLSPAFSTVVQGESQAVLTDCVSSTTLPSSAKLDSSALFNACATSCNCHRPCCVVMFAANSVYLQLIHPVLCCCVSLAVTLSVATHSSLGNTTQETREPLSALPETQEQSLCLSKLERKKSRWSPENNTPHVHYFYPEEQNAYISSSQLPKESEPPPAVAVVLRDVFLLCIFRGHLDARLFMLFTRAAEALDLPLHALTIAVQEEFAAAFELIQGTMQKDTKESTKAKHLRRLKVAGVAVGLGALTAVTAGLAAPAIAAGFGALGIAGMSGTAAFLATTGGYATVASVFGAGTAGFSGWKYFKRIGKIKVFQFDKLQPCVGIAATQTQNVKKDAKPGSEKSSSSVLLSPPVSGTPSGQLSLSESEVERLLCTSEQNEYHEALLPKTKSDPDLTHSSRSACRLLPLTSTSRRLAPPSSPNVRAAVIANIPPAITVTICISGWLRRIADVWRPWRGICSSPTEVYALRWDPTILLDLGTFMLNILSQRFAVTAANLWLQTTIAGALTVALMWPIALIQYASGLDNTWMVCRERATQAGKLLAEALKDEKAVGSRPVSLIGFSMGARVIYACLLQLHRLNALHRVASVVLIGAPVSCDRTSWQRAREVVSGRLVNVYSRADWLLAFLFRYMEWGITVAGLSPVKVEGVENVDVTGIVRSHGQYADKIQDILAYIGYHALHQQVRYPAACPPEQLLASAQQNEDEKSSSDDDENRDSLETTLLPKT